MQLRCSGPADHQRNGKACLFHFMRNDAHFFQRRGYQTTQTEYIGLFFFYFLNNHFRRSHHPEVYYLIVVTGKDNRYDILTYIVYIAFHGSNNQFSGFVAPCRRCFLRFQSRLQNGHGTFHCTGSLYNLRKEHFTGTEKITDFVHTIHQRFVDNIYGLRIHLKRFRQVFFQIVTNSLYQRILDTLIQWIRAPFFYLLLCLS